MSHDFHSQLLPGVPYPARWIDLDIDRDDLAWSELLYVLERMPWLEFGVVRMPLVDLTQRDPLLARAAGVMLAHDVDGSHLPVRPASEWRRDRSRSSLLFGLHPQA